MHEDCPLLGDSYRNVLIAESCLMYWERYTDDSSYYIKKSGEKISDLCGNCGQHNGMILARVFKGFGGYTEHSRDGVRSWLRRDCHFRHVGGRTGGH